MTETQAVVPPDAEKLLTALDHLDAAYDLAAGVYAPISDHIHLAREEAKRHAGHLIYEASVRARQTTRIDGPLGPEESDTSGAYRTGDVTVLGDLIDSEVVEWPAHRDGLAAYTADGGNALPEDDPGD